MTALESVALGLGISVAVVAVVLLGMPWLYELGQVKGWHPLGWYDRYNDRVEAAVHGWWQRTQQRRQPDEFVTGSVGVDRALGPVQFHDALDHHLELLRRAMIRDYENR